MARLSLGRLLAGCFAALAVIILVQTDRAEAQGTGVERVKFDTFDSAELVGSFYPGGRGNKSSCAIILHAVGEHSQKEGWDELAKSLQGKGISVLTFDLRGHGDSTNVGPSFYNREATNQTLKSYRSAKLKDKITYKDFTQLDHFGVMVNDVVAAKRFLDRKNDSGECNSGNVILIGAESGATLGALYLKWAAFQHQAKFGQLGLAVASEKKEIDDIAGAVWLSMSSSLSPNPNTARVNVANWVRAPVKDKVPMCFLYGENDKKAAELAKTLNDNVLRGGVKDKDVKLTLRKELKGTKLAGRELLTDKLPTQAHILEYVARVLDSRGGNVWTKREIDRLPPVSVPFKNILR